MLFPRSRIFVWPCIILDEKASTSSFFCCFDHLIQVSWIYSSVCDSFPLNQKFCSFTSQQLGYPESIQGNQQLIDFTFLDHIGDLIDGGHAQST